MRTLLLIFMIIFLPGTLISQHYHFVYIQGENQQVFYIKKTGDLLSSSATGFIILPKLQSGTHQFTVGFPKNQWPEYEFLIEVKSADRGFTLKNFGDKGWGLFDLQTLDIIYGKKIDPPKVEVAPETPKSDDPFAVILASAVGDPGIRETALVAMKFDKPAPVVSKVTPAAPPVTKNDPAPVKTSQVPAREGSKPVIVAAPPAATGETVKTNPPPPPVTGETAKTSAPPITVPVDAGNKTDEKMVETPAVIKADQPKKENGKAAPAFESEPVLPSIPVQAKVDSANAVQKNIYPPLRQVRKISEIRSWKTTELIFIDTYGSISDTITVIIENELVEEPKKELAAVTAPAPLPNRLDCKDMASEKDMLNLRKKVLRLKTEEEMLELTLKDIRSKCYSVDMLQNTSYVFVSDRMRYSLFESALPYIFDPANYSKLERLLTSEEYINRFRELIKTK
jgi:hypothetical protein